MRVLCVLAAAAACAGCATASPGRSGPARPDGAAARLERALRVNPGRRASSAACRPATAPERARAPFGRTRARLFACRIGFGGAAPERYVVQLLRSGCFVGERVRRGAADLGC